MAQGNANKIKAWCTVNDLKPETFNVTRFSGVDEISVTYRFTIDLISSDNTVSAASVIGKRVTLYISRGELLLPYSGIASSFSFIEKTVDFTRYTLELSARLMTLDLSRKSRVYQKMSSLAVVKKVLDDSGLSDYYEVACGKEYPSEEFIMQYDETDLNFIRRIMQRTGMWFFFKEEAKGAQGWKTVSSEKMVVTDDPETFRSIEEPESLYYRSHSGMETVIDKDEKEYVSAIRFQRKLVPAKVKMKNYNYRTPEMGLDAVKAVDGGDLGEDCAFGGDGRDSTRLTKAAEIRANMEATRQCAVTGEGNGKAFRAGCRFTLMDSPHPDITDHLLILKVTHRGKLTHEASLSMTDNDELDYDNGFTAMAASRMNTFMPYNDLVQPKVNGVVSAKIESPGGEYAHIDEKGRYKIRLPFDTADASAAEASKYIRLSQHYSGTGYGMHFPAHAETEMLVGYINGDPDKPIGLGTVPNGNTISPVTSNNKSQSVIRTAGNNEIILDDMDQKQKIHISTNAKNMMDFDDEKKVITIKTTDDNKVVLDDQNKLVSINAAENVITVSYDDNGSKVTIVTKDGHNFSLDDENRLIELKTSGGHIITLDDENETLELTDAENSNSVILDKNEGVFISTDNNLEFHAEGDISMEGANISLRSDGAIEAEADSDITLQSTDIAASAQNNVEIEAGANASLKGSINAELKGATQAVINGGIVNIN